MIERKPKELIREYIHVVATMVQLSEGGIFALYGLEQHRINLHNKICEVFGIDKIKSKDLLNYMEEKLNFSFYNLTDDILNEYTEKLYNYLLLHKDDYKERSQEVTYNAK